MGKQWPDIAMDNMDLGIELDKVGEKPKGTTPPGKPISRGPIPVSAPTPVQPRRERRTPWFVAEIVGIFAAIYLGIFTSPAVIPITIFFVFIIVGVTRATKDIRDLLEER